MKIFLDTANLDEIQQACVVWLVAVITPNPTLAARVGRPCRERILEACEIVKDGVVNAEVVSTDTDRMLREGRELASWHSNIVVKVPMTPAGVGALHVLHGEGIRINVTLVFSAAQALLVAKAGAYFVSPFLGRLDDTAQEGLHVLSEIMDIYRAYQFPTQVLAASLRGPLHVVAAARMGVHIVSMPCTVV